MTNLLVTAVSAEQNEAENIEPPQGKVDDLTATYAAMANPEWRANSTGNFPASFLPP